MRSVIFHLMINIFSWSVLFAEAMMISVASGFLFPFYVLFLVVLLSYLKHLPVPVLYNTLNGVRTTTLSLITTTSGTICGPGRNLPSWHSPSSFSVVCGQNSWNKKQSQSNHIGLTQLFIVWMEIYTDTWLSAPLLQNSPSCFNICFSLWCLSRNFFPLMWQDL